MRDHLVWRGTTNTSEITYFNPASSSQTHWEKRSLEKWWKNVKGHRPGAYHIHQTVTYFCPPGEVTHPRYITKAGGCEGSLDKRQNGIRWRYRISQKRNNQVKGDGLLNSRVHSLDSQFDMDSFKTLSKITIPQTPSESLGLKPPLEPLDGRLLQKKQQLTEGREEGGRESKYAVHTRTAKEGLNKERREKRDARRTRAGGRLSGSEAAGDSQADRSHQHMDMNPNTIYSWSLLSKTCRLALANG